MVIHLCDKMSDAISRFVDVVIVVEMNFFLLERAYESFSISILSRSSALCDGNLDAMFLECCDIGPLKNTARLDRNDESQGRCGTMPLRGV